MNIVVAPHEMEVESRTLNGEDHPPAKIDPAFKDTGAESAQAGSAMFMRMAKAQPYFFQERTDGATVVPPQGAKLPEEFRVELNP